MLANEYFTVSANPTAMPHPQPDLPLLVLCSHTCSEQIQTSKNLTWENRSGYAKANNLPVASEAFLAKNKKGKK